MFREKNETNRASGSDIEKNQNIKKSHRNENWQQILNLRVKNTLAKYMFRMCDIFNESIHEYFVNVYLSLLP